MIQSGIALINELIAIIGLLITVLVLVVKATYEITKMKSQLFPNGGSSLNDKVTRLQIEVVKIRATIDSIEKQLGEKPKRKR
jgi:hypothetical protein